MDIRFTPRAEKDWQKIGSTEQKRIMEKITLFAAAPHALQNQVKKLVGTDSWRLRVGDYRVVFTEDGLLLRVLRVAHRREVYR